MDATNKTSKKLIRFLGDNAITLCLVVLVVVIICINPKFFSFNVLRDVLLQNATKLIMACGMMFVLISGGVDLSAGRILGLAAVLTASLGQTIDYSRPGSIPTCRTSRSSFRFWSRWPSACCSASSTAP